MSLSSFTITDVEGCLVGAVAFALVLLAPGYVAGWTTDLLGFRRRTLAERLVWSAPLSFGLSIAPVMAARYLSLLAACWLVAGLSLLAVGLVALEVLRRSSLAKQRTGIGRTGWMIAAGILLWSLFVAGELLDVGLGNKLYMSTTVYDHSIRTAFVDAVVRTGVPPGNPLYWIESGGVGHAAPTRYYYFWYVITAMAVKLGGISARQAMAASCVWGGFALAATIALYCRYFLSGSRRLTSIAIGLLAVTGLDLIPVVVAFLQGQPTDPDMEWWSQGQVTSWMDTLLWVPHHMASLVCCLFGFLLIWMSANQGRRQRLLCGLVAGAAFGSSLGLSTYVAAAFAMVMASWLVWVLVWDKSEAHLGRQRVTVLLLAGVTSVILVMPYLRDLRQSDRGTGGKVHLFAVGVRPIINADGLAGEPGFRQLRARSVTLEEEAVHLLLLLPGYAAELGFFGLVLLILLVRIWRRETLGEAERTAMFLTVAGLVVASFVKSAVTETNDFGFRSMLIPQFFLLLLAATLVDGGMRAPGRAVRILLVASLAIGVAGTIYQALLLRLYLPVEDRLGRQGLEGLAERNMALRDAFDRMDGKVSRAAVVQYNTLQPNEYFIYSALINLNRQTVSAMPKCDTAFGGDPAFCAGIEAGIARLYEQPAKEVQAATTVGDTEVRELCSRLGIDDLVATRWDRVWQEREGWVRRLPMVLETANVRVMDCRTGLR
jgi:hypothetical protein